MEASLTDTRHRGKPTACGPFLMMILAVALVPTRGLPQSNDLAVLAVKFGQLYGQGLVPEARDVAAELLERLEQTRGRSDLDLAANLNNFASLSYAEGEVDAAEPVLLRALEIYEAVVGSGHPSAATVLYNLAGVYLQQGKDEQAQELYQRLIDMNEANGGRNKPRRAEVLNNLGFLLLRQERFERAERLFQEALRIWEEAIDADSPQAAIALSNLALLRAKKGSLGEAEKLYSRALAVEEEIFGPEHPEVATTLNNLGMLYRVQGKPNDAFARHHQALRILEAALGLGDALTLETIRYLGGLLGEVDRRLLASGEPFNVYQIIVLRTKTEADSLFQSIQSGEAFAALARDYSRDESASGGGHIRAHPVDLHTEIRVRLEQLEEGEVSLPFPIDGGWLIVKKIYEPSGTRPKASVIVQPETRTDR